MKYAEGVYSFRFDRYELLALVTIRAASFCIFLSLFASYCVQLPQITSAYSGGGRIKEKHMSLK